MVVEIHCVGGWVGERVGHNQQVPRTHTPQSPMSVNVLLSTPFLASETFVCCTECMQEVQMRHAILPTPPPCPAVIAPPLLQSQQLPAKGG